MWLEKPSWEKPVKEINVVNSLLCSAVHRSRRAGVGVLTYFAGAGAEAGVCSPPVKL